MAATLSPTAELDAGSGGIISESTPLSGSEGGEKEKAQERNSLTTNVQPREETTEIMSTENEGEARPSFLVGDPEDPESPQLSNGNQDEDRDHFNQNLSQKPSGFDLAEKRRRLR